MPTVSELTALYGNFMLCPRRGPGVCEICFNLTDGYKRCYTCARGELWLDAVCPISYSVANEQLHHALGGYKRLRGEAARQMTVGLAAVLWRYLERHEPCVARAADARRLALVTTVPPGHSDPELHPLRRIVAELVKPTRDRYVQLLGRAKPASSSRTFDRDRYRTLQSLDGQSVLLIDDTWTTGASAQSAAAALKQAGAGVVAGVVIGRHMNRDWHENDHRLREIHQPFDWDRCALCAD